MPKDDLSGQPHHHDASGRRRGLGEVASLTPLEPCTCADLEPEPQGLVLTIPDHDMDRLQLLLDDLAAPLAAYVAVQVNERDGYREQLTQARALNNRLTKALAYLVKEWPQTSWGSSNEAHDTAQALLDELAGEGATMGTPDSAPVQENTDHAPSHQDPPDA